MKSCGKIRKSSSKIGNLCGITVNGCGKTNNSGENGRSCFQHENRPESTPSLAKVGISHKLKGWFGFQGPQTMLTSQNNASPAQAAS